jgi:hypothetical protein
MLIVMNNMLEIYSCLLLNGGVILGDNFVGIVSLYLQHDPSILARSGIIWLPRTGISDNFIYGHFWMTVWDALGCVYLNSIAMSVNRPILTVGFHVCSIIFKSLALAFDKSYITKNIACQDIKRSVMLSDWPEDRKQRWINNLNDRENQPIFSYIHDLLTQDDHIAAVEGEVSGIWWDIFRMGALQCMIWIPTILSWWYNK